MSKQMSSGSFKNCYQQTIRLQIIYMLYFNLEDLALNNLKNLTCKTQPTNQPII